MWEGEGSLFTSLSNTPSWQALTLAEAEHSLCHPGIHAGSKANV